MRTPTELRESRNTPLLPELAYAIASSGGKRFMGVVCGAGGGGLRQIGVGMYWKFARPNIDVAFQGDDNYLWL